MIVWPGLRRSVSAISRLFNSAAFDAPLTHSAIPTRAASGTTATFTRATTATVRDNEGVLRTAIAGEARFEGARRVRNLLPSSEDLTSGWTATGGTLAAGSITESGATSVHYAQTTSMVIPATAIFIMQAEIKQSVGTRNIGIGTNSVGNAIFNPSTGVFVANDGPTLDHGTGTQTADGYWPVWVKVHATTSNKPIISLYSGTTQSYAGDGASQVLVRKLQLEDVTAQTTQTAGEYVSVGVASSPYYHGSMVDGVKCFPTDLSGNPIPSTTLLGYLAEGARTNLIVRSNELDNASWTKNNATISANGAVASDGTTSLDKIVEAATTSTHTVYQTFAGTSGSYTISVEMKQAERTWGFITEGNSVTATAYFNLAAGTVGTVSGTGSPSATITALANGAYRCTMSFTAGANANCQFGPATGDGAASYAGDITKGIYAGMVGFENASSASSYIATTTTAVTRNADLLTYSGGDIPNLKTLCATFKRESGVSGVGVIAVLTAGTDANTAAAYLSSATASAFAGVVASVTQWSQATSNAYTPGTTSKMAWSQATNDIKMAKDGTAQTQDTVATVPSSTALQVGYQNGAFQLNGNVGGIYGWTRNFSQSELNAVTA